jgi:hypothetical protein
VRASRMAETAITRHARSSTADPDQGSTAGLSQMITEEYLPCWGIIIWPAPKSEIALGALR